jgi:hypothetical protein
MANWRRGNLTGQPLGCWVLGDGEAKLPELFTEVTVLRVDQRFLFFQESIRPFTARPAQRQSHSSRVNASGGRLCA